jgi:hypothetical protein
VAAACAVLAITYVFFPSLEKTPAGQPLISKAEKPKVERVEERSLSVEEKLPVEIILKKVKQEGFIPKAEKSIAAISDSIPDFDFVTIEKQKVVLPLIANTPIKNASEEPALSPSALRLRERLQQLNPDSLAQQVIIEEKFNFFNELQRSYTHAYTNETTSPVLNNFLKNKDENN